MKQHYYNTGQTIAKQQQQKHEKVSFRYTLTISETVREAGAA